MSAAGGNVQGGGPAPRINLDQPRYDQSTYVGRAKHFFFITNPLNIFATGAQLERAKEIVTAYRHGQRPKYTVIRPTVVAVLLKTSTENYHTTEHPLDRKNRMLDRLILFAVIKFSVPLQFNTKSQNLAVWDRISLTSNIQGGESSELNSHWLPMSRHVSFISYRLSLTFGLQKRHGASRPLRRWHLGVPSSCTTPPITRTLARRCSYWAACLARCLVTWPSRDAWWPSTSEYLRRGKIPSLFWKHPRQGLSHHAATGYVCLDAIWVRVHPWVYHYAAARL